MCTSGRPAWLTSILVVCALLLHPLPRALGSNEGVGQRDTAATTFAKARQLFLAGDYRAAIDQFERAYRLKPHFLVQCSIARCYELLDSLEQAAVHYRRCLDEGASRSPMAGRVERSLAKVRLSILGRKKAEADAAADTGQPASSPAPAAASETSPLAAPPTPPPRPARRSLSPAWFWIAAAATLAFGTTTAVLGAKTIGCKQDYQADPTREGYQTCWRYRLLTNIFAGATAASAGAGITVFFFTDFGAKAERDAPHTARIAITLQGTF